MYRYADIRVVHLEMTSRCNAACPMCARNIQGGRVNPNMPLDELTLEDIKKIFLPDFVVRLKRMYMCGNYGDALVARDTAETFEYFHEHNPKIDLRLWTNGSGRTADWWKRLAGVLDACVFSIDGLEDTNHLYRRGTHWPKIMAAIEAFIGAGGAAEWEFLVFRHNEHQIDAARELAAKLGFKKFTPKRTDRFWRDGRRVERTEVLDEEGRFLYHLEQPQSPAWRNAALAAIDKVTEGQKDYQSYLDTTEIDCKVQKDGQIFVSAEGLVLPCCWTGKLYVPERKPGEGQLWRMINGLPAGKDSLSARKHTLEEIVDGPFFQDRIPGGWRPNEGKEKPRLAICARLCGKFDLIKAMREPAS